MAGCMNQCGVFADFDVCICYDKAIVDRVIDSIYKPPRAAVAPPVAPMPEQVVDQYAPFESLYELTLTTDVDDPYELRQALSRIVKSAMFEVKGYIACIELTRAGLPHIHALLFSKRKYIDGTKIKKLYAKRYECKRVRLPGNYYAYINKEKDNPLVVDYCAKKGVQQLFEELILN